MGLYDLIQSILGINDKPENILKPVTTEDVFDGYGQINYPLSLKKEIHSCLINETEGERKERLKSEREMTHKIMEEYGVRGNGSFEGGFAVNPMSYRDLRFMYDSIKKMDVGFRFSRVSPQSEDGQILLKAGVAYVNGLVDLYREKPWKQT